MCSTRGIFISERDSVTRLLTLFLEKTWETCKLFYFREDIREIACQRYQQLCRDDYWLCGHWWWILKASHWLYRNNQVNKVRLQFQLQLFGNWWQVSNAVANCCRFDFFYVNRSRQNLFHIFPKWFCLFERQKLSSLTKIFQNTFWNIFSRRFCQK